MRGLLFAFASVVSFSTASAQTVDSRCIGCRIEWDGSAELCWKVNNPSTASDAFSVDLDNRCAGLEVVAICAGFCDTNPAAGAVPGFLSICPDNLVVDPTGRTPDKLNPCVGVVKPTGNPGTFCTDVVAYDVPDKCLGSTNLHVVQGFCPGDSSLWLCADSSGPWFANSYFTTDCYATPAIGFTVNWMLGPGVIPKPVRFWVNGGTSTTIEELDTVALLFVGSCSFQPFMIFLTNCAGGLIVPAINLVFFTGIGAVDDAGNTACIVAAWPCEAFHGTLCLGTVYKECPPSRKIKISNDVAITVNHDTGCDPPINAPYGKKDDGVLDSTIWKTMNPTGSGDWFNVHHGVAPSSVSTLTGVDVSSWNFCAVGSPWGEVGIYNSNLTLDPSGGTPKLPGAAVNVGQVVPAAQSDWGCPATLYDTADIGTGGGDWHGAAKWATADSCLWLGSDTDGTDDAFSNTSIPATCSYFAPDNFAAPAIQFTPANWMIRLLWR